MNVCSVIVTYGNRFSLLTQVIDSLFRSQHVRSIIVVDNNSSEESKRDLVEFEKRLNGRLKVVYLTENTGSAKGYKIGLQQAYACAECEFLWLLDDDNKPYPGALEHLIDAWILLNDSGASKTTALLSYREDNSVYRRIKSGENYKNWIKRNDYFLGFHIQDVLNRIKAKFLSKKSRIPAGPQVNILTLPYAVYGGLFFHKDLLDVIGYPTEEFFVYGDDHEFTYRVTKRGGKLLLVLNSKIEDIIKSWNYANPESIDILPLFLRGKDLKRIYYTVRNAVIFDIVHFKTNDFSFAVNRFIYLNYLRFFALLFGRLQNFRTIIKAVRDGELLAPKVKADSEKKHAD